MSMEVPTPTSVIVILVVGPFATSDADVSAATMSPKAKVCFMMLPRDSILARPALMLAFFKLAGSLTIRAEPRAAVT